MKEVKNYNVGEKEANLDDISKKKEPNLDDGSKKLQF